MFSWRKFFPGITNAARKPATAPSSATGIPGYHLPASARALTSVKNREPFLQQLWENSALPEKQYRLLYLNPVQRLLARVQNVPATHAGSWAGCGGYGDMVVRFVAYAVRLNKAHLLPQGAAPEEQATQSLHWSAVVFWSALFYHLPLLSQMEGELRSGLPWLPGMSEPTDGYRFRFRASVQPALQAQCAATLAACQLLPCGATAWLSAVPASLDCLAQRLYGMASGMPAIDDLLDSAAQKAGVVIMPAQVHSFSAGTTFTLPVPSSGAEPDNDFSHVPGDIANTAFQGKETTPSARAADVMMSLRSAFTDAVEPDNGSPDTVLAEPEITDSDTAALLALFRCPDKDISDGVIKMSPEPPPHSDSAESLPIRGPEGRTENGVIKTLSYMGGIIAKAPLSAGKNTGEQVCLPVNIVGPYLPGAQGDFSEKTTPPATLSVPVLTQSDCVPQGEDFWHWLRSGINSGSLSVNGPEDALHLVAGFVLIPVPEMFFRYLKDTGREGRERERVQSAFELLNRHKRRNNRRFFFARIYASGEGHGPFRRVKGYLVRASLLFDKVPQDSRYLNIS